MADSHITYDPIYNTIDRDNFLTLIEPDRYAERADAFDGIISATVDHFWDPMDSAYIDFDAKEDFDLREQLLMPREFAVELQCAVADKLTPTQQIELANSSTHFMLSSILHGEQGALIATAKPWTISPASGPTMWSPITLSLARSTINFIMVFSSPPVRVCLSALNVDR